MGSEKPSFEVFSNTIDGKSHNSGKTSHAIDPSTGKSLWEVPCASPQDLDDAVAAAQNSFETWSTTPWKQRQGLLTEVRQALEKVAEEMVTLIMREGGKPRQVASIEVEHAGRFLDFNANTPALEVDVVQDDSELLLTHNYVPIGVVGAICPWNFPLVLAVGKISAALVTGNCIIIKPSPYTPYSILKFVEIVHTILPHGVLQALNGDDGLGPLMTKHPGIAKISFTGSTATGKRVMQAASQTLKAVTLELGGNSASIICQDVDINQVALQVAIGSFFNSGQFCLASKRIYVHESIYDQFRTALVEITKSWKAGSPFADDTVLGPVQNKMQYDIVLSFFEDCRRNGYKFALDGGPSGKVGFVVQPAIIDNPPSSSMIVTGEPFGPIFPLLSWKTDDEVIASVNNVSSGLGGAVWSADLNRAKSLANRIEAGTIWINSFEKPLPQGHLAGWKDSGVGGEWGRPGLLSYCKVKTIHQYKEKVGTAGK